MSAEDSSIWQKPGVTVPTHDRLRFDEKVVPEPAGERGRGGLILVIDVAG